MENETYNSSDSSVEQSKPQWSHPLKIVERVKAAVITGFVFSFFAFLYMGITVGFTATVTWGVLIWYTFIGLIIGLIGTIKEHPVFGFHMLFIRGILIAGTLNLSIALMAEQEFHHIFAFIPFPIEIAFLLEGIVVGAIIDGIATKFGGEGKELLQKM